MVNSAWHTTQACSNAMSASSARHEPAVARCTHDDAVVHNTSLGKGSLPDTPRGLKFSRQHAFTAHHAATSCWLAQEPCTQWLCSNPCKTAVCAITDAAPACCAQCNIGKPPILNVLSARGFQEPKSNSKRHTRPLTHSTETPCLLTKPLVTSGSCLQGKT